MGEVCDHIKASDFTTSLHQIIKIGIKDVRVCMWPVVCLIHLCIAGENTIIWIE